VAKSVLGHEKALAEKQLATGQHHFRLMSPLISGSVENKATNLFGASAFVWSPNWRSGYNVVVFRRVERGLFILEDPRDEEPSINKVPVQTRRSLKQE
jgi:hypothetical protein